MKKYLFLALLLGAGAVNAQDSAIVIKPSNGFFGNQFGDDSLAFYLPPGKWETRHDTLQVEWVIFVHRKGLLRKFKTKQIVRRYEYYNRGWDDRIFSPDDTRKEVYLINGRPQEIIYIKYAGL